MAIDTPKYFRNLVIYEIYVRNHGSNGTFSDVEDDLIRIKSMGVDVMPHPIDWNDTKRMYLFCGYVMRTAEVLGIGIRMGCDWDMDTEVLDNTFNDLVHFELT